MHAVSSFIDNLLLVISNTFNDNIEGPQTERLVISSNACISLLFLSSDFSWKPTEICSGLFWFLVVNRSSWELIAILNIIRYSILVLVWVFLCKILIRVWDTLALWKSESKFVPCAVCSSYNIYFSSFIMFQGPLL